MAEPHRIRPALRLIDSEDDSWLLPAAKPAWPAAQLWPA